MPSQKNGCPQLLTKIQQLPSTKNRTHPGVSVSNASTYVTLAFVYWEESALVRVKIKGVPRQAEVALGVPGRLRPRIISTFGTTRVVSHQPYALAAFTPGEIPGTHFQRLSQPQGTWFCRMEPRKKIHSDTTGNRSRDRLTSSVVP